MDVVKATAIQLLRRIRSQDILSVVTFSDHADCLISSSRSMELTRLEARIQMLQASGGTELYQGLEAAYQQVLHNFKKSYVNHIIILTDGHTYGDEQNCLDLADKAVQKGIGISGLGIGNEWNDVFLDELVRRTGGSSMYVSQPSEIQKQLLEKFNHLWQVFAEDTVLTFKISEGISLRYAFRLQPEVGLLPVESPLPLGPIPRDDSLKVLFEFFVEPEASKKDVVSLLEGKLDISVSTLSVPPPPIEIDLKRPVTEKTEPEPPPQEIISALSHLTLYRLQDQARLEVSSGEYDQAAKHLKLIATHLLLEGEKGLARDVLEQAEHIQQNKKYSKDGDKLIKYGTRALLMPGREKEGT